MTGSLKAEKHFEINCEFTTVDPGCLSDVHVGGECAGWIHLQVLRLLAFTRRPALSQLLRRVRIKSKVHSTHHFKRSAHSHSVYFMVKLFFLFFPNNTLKRHFLLLAASAWSYVSSETDNMNLYSIVFPLTLVPFGEYYH